MNHPLLLNLLGLRKMICSSNLVQILLDDLLQWIILAHASSFVAAMLIFFESSQFFSFQIYWNALEFVMVHAGFLLLQLDHTWLSLSLT